MSTDFFPSDFATTSLAFLGTVLQQFTPFFYFVIPVLVGITIIAILFGVLSHRR